jgi:hypothetical protein
VSRVFCEVEKIDGSTDRSQRAEQVADFFGVVIYGGATDFLEIEAGVKRVGDRIGRFEINFADNAGMSSRFGTLKKIGIESAGVTFAADGGRGDDSIDIHEIGIGGIGMSEEILEPGKILVFVGSGLVKRDEQGVRSTDGCGEERYPDEAIEFVESQRREFGGVVIVEL